MRVELTAPDGSTWAWGPADATDRITGPALDFALLITHRRHRDDLALTVVGAAATEWVEIGQAFAGEPGVGRAPGQLGGVAPRNSRIGPCETRRAPSVRTMGTSSRHR